MSNLPPVEQFRALVKRLGSNQFLNRELQSICRLNALPTHGVKAELQKRIIEALTKAYASGDVSAYRELAESIRREKEVNPPAASYGYPAPQQQLPHDARASPTPYGRANLALPSINNMSNHGYSSASTSASTSNGHPSYGAYNGVLNGHRAYQPSPQGMSYQIASPYLTPTQFDQQLRPHQQVEGPTFKPSPFYRVEQRIGNVHFCQAMSQHRHSINIQIKAQDTPLLKQFADDKSLRVMVFCGTEEFGMQDIAFPHQSEMKVNGDDVKANLRGLKNKPGSTRPVDITDLLRLRIPAYPNNIEFTYALTTKAGDKSSQYRSQKFWLVINICRSVPVEMLVDTVSKKKISKESVMKELTKEAQDAEIELSSQVLSLKCPISYMRLSTPVRADTCKHVQCFDALSYLQLQQQGPQWVCPVCSKSAPFHRLAIDEYVRDILDRTSKSVEQVDIKPDGQWKAHGPVEEEEIKPEPRYDAYNLDDDDFVVSEVSPAGGRSTSTPGGYRSTHTPANLAPPTAAPTPGPEASREGSSMSRSGGNKRSHDVIDLTLSDDDDEEPQPPPKRQQFNRPGAGYPSFY